MSTPPSPPPPPDSLLERVRFLEARVSELETQLQVLAKVLLDR